jgi:hypothetical protein
VVLHCRFPNLGRLGLGLALAALQLACNSPTGPGAQPEGFGFQSIFDGATLAGWEGDQKYWRAENGVLVGEITPATVVRSNTFIVWRGGRPKDFELKLEYRISADGNSGINYRSTIVPDTITPENRFAMRGYQCDIDGRQLYTGNNYEEKGRMFLALRGQMTRVGGGGPPTLLSTLGESDRRPDSGSYRILSSPASRLVQNETTVGVTLISTMASLSGPSSNHCSSSFSHSSCFFSASRTIRARPVIETKRQSPGSA